jgi:hypothetical protein
MQVHNDDWLLQSAVESGAVRQHPAGDGSRRRQLAERLRHRLDLQRKSNKPVVLSRMDPADSHADAFLLDALAAEVRVQFGDRGCSQCVRISSRSMMAFSKVEADSQLRVRRTASIMTQGSV